MEATKFKSVLIFSVLGSILFLAAAVFFNKSSSSLDPRHNFWTGLYRYQQRRLQEKVVASSISAQTKVFIAIHDDDSPTARKQRESFQQEEVLRGFHLVANTTLQQYEFLLENPCVDGAAPKYRALTKSNRSDLAEELWKYCALWRFGGLYLDSEIQLLKPFALRKAIEERNKASKDGLAMSMDSFAPNSIHGSFLWLRQPGSKVALQMAQQIVSTSTFEPLQLPQALHGFLQESENQWDFLQQTCSENPFHRPIERVEDPMNDIELYSCSRFSGLCCFVYDGQVAVFGSRKPVHPLPKISFRDLPKPLLYQKVTTVNSNNPNNPGPALEQLPFIATIKESTTPSVETPQGIKSPPTFYEVMKEKDCLPSHSCNKCLADKKHGATCETCLEVCPCFCAHLCKEQGAKPTASHQYLATPPLHRLDPTRLIPRIVHQTWFEHLNSTKYPNMSRLTQSFKTSGWEWKFYTDETARSFLSEHFPSQVVEAYDLLLPGAFKADLFRYCCLLIHGGVYADVDIMVGPFLDAAIAPDVGFMVGLDEPGKRIGKRMCLWNGFIAAAPGHPFLAKTIENAVNNIHRRFTSVDVAEMHCPLPEMSIITSFSPLFVAGPCMLGSTINSLLGRHGQSNFEAGELLSKDGGMELPGRTVILNQNKNDMGAHRFTMLEKNLIVFSTDFPDSDDREKLDNYEHYSETRVRFEIYGIDGVYKDTKRNSTSMIQLGVSK